MRIVAAMTAFVLAAGMVGNTAEAGRYAVSKSPHWAVGKFDTRLSSLCQRHRFNQIRHHRIHISFAGGEGSGIIGVAAKGYNLYDPQGLAQPDVHYHFFNDGYSNCRVYWAPVR